jgi:hypothetical protein
MYFIFGGKFEYIYILVEYHTRCCMIYYDLRKINIIKNNKKKNNMTMQSIDMFYSYKKVWYKNQIN